MDFGYWSYVECSSCSLYWEYKYVLEDCYEECSYTLRECPRCKKLRLCLNWMCASKYVPLIELIEE